MRTRWVLLAAAIFASRCSAQFESRRADASLCSADGCVDFKLVLANFGVFPYGEYLECVPAVVACQISLHVLLTDARFLALLSVHAESTWPVLSVYNTACALAVYALRSQPWR